MIIVAKDIEIVDDDSVYNSKENDGCWLMRDNNNNNKSVNYDDKDRSSMLINPETDDIERQLFMMKKRGGARAFGPMRSNNYEHLFVPNIKRHQTLSPYYYYYQQPKRGGGHPFYTYLSENGGDGNTVLQPQEIAPLLARANGIPFRVHGFMMDNFTLHFTFTQ
ncbi:hypothetical protein DINM_004033 [Dirofilaria immitis]|nr:hypothetical protein [Dirofilaria immitis]